MEEGKKVRYSGFYILNIIIQSTLLNKFVSKRLVVDIPSHTLAGRAGHCCDCDGEEFSPYAFFIE